jgi:hypothetical protein
MGKRRLGNNIFPKKDLMVIAGDAQLSVVKPKASFDD